MKDSPSQKSNSPAFSILDKMPGVLFEYEVRHEGSRNFTYLSPRADDILGISREKLLAGTEPMESFILPEDLPSFQKTFQDSTQQGKPFAWEGRVWAGNNVIWLQVQANLSSHDADKQVWHGLMLDATDRKRNELTRIESEQRYETLLNQLPLGIAVHHRGILLFANPFVCDLLGAAGRAQLEGRPLMDFVHADYQAVAQERSAQADRAEPLPPVEQKLVRLDGTTVTVIVSSIPIIYRGESATQSIIRNISDEKRAQREIRLQEILFTQLFTASPIAITLLDNRGNVAKVNEAFENLFGYSREELMNRSLNEFIVPEQLTNEGNDLNTLISSKHVVRFETFRLRKDRSKINVIIYGVPVQMENESIGIFGLYVDITERKKVEEELKIRNTELDNFVYKVSHDLRAPLSSIRGLIKLAEMPGNTDNPVEYLKLIGQKAEQLDHFISDILIHSKNLKLEVTVAPIDFRAMIHQIFVDLDYLSGAKGIHTDIQVDAHPFFNDPWRLGEVLRNLISNAIKYRRLDIDNAFIRIQVRIDEKKAIIHFSDNGIGIEPAALTRIFEMFYRASAQSEGSGIGLYIVKNAIDKLGGTIEVDSELTRGTSFKVTLPNRVQSQ
ncbi:MAG: PAS domain S-box protein [Cyclobacteriaceae bacterium]|nr:PAS domain S-box protein [Cyclobacteriaceae bacterium]